MNTYDLQLEVATANAASSSTWNNMLMSWGEMVSKLSSTHRTKETIKQYLAMSKTEQGTIKDVGGYVGGYCANGKRKKGAILRRSMLTLDIDFAAYDFFNVFTFTFDCAAVLHSTHKHTQSAPRYRLIIPLDRYVAPDEYQAIARKVAELLNIEVFDPTTFDVNRLMFWASSSIDGEYIFREQQGFPLSADYVLSMYQNWRDVSQWAQHSAQAKHIANGIEKQADPELKKGVIGAFCRTYNIPDAIGTFLSDKYRPTYAPDRYTYIDGSTEGGLIIYEDGKFAYSHHGTDPAQGNTLNAFDLVRIHKFGINDMDSTQSGSKLPSFKMMEEYARNLPEVKNLLITENLDKAKSEFSVPYQPLAIPLVTSINNLANEVNSADENWTSKLSIDKQGNFLTTSSNISLIIKNDPVLKDAFAYNEFDNKRYIKRSIAWRSISDKYDLVKDVDYAGVRNYIDCVYGISSVQKIDDVLALEFNKNRFHPVIEYLDSLQWDGIKRVDEILIKYLGADDNIYTREAIRKSLTAAVARVKNAGCKFDSVLVLCGEEGTGKSTLFNKLGRGWFSDTFTTVQGKEAFEQLQGHWIIEMAELAGLRKAEAETVKHFIAKQEDSFRPAYGRTTETFKRQCVFFGTSNKQWFLKEANGNRRFLPVDICKAKIQSFVWDGELDRNIDQIWAEANYLYSQGESLVLSPEAEQLARLNRDSHSDTDERTGIIEDYLDMLLPLDWDNMPIEIRRNYFNNPEQRATKGKVLRMSVCVAEIWVECLGKNKEDMTRYNTRDINDILRTLKIWELKKSTKAFKLYGTQKAYERTSL